MKTFILVSFQYSPGFRGYLVVDEWNKDTIAYLSEYAASERRNGDKTIWRVQQVYSF